MTPVFRRLVTIVISIAVAVVATWLVEAFSASENLRPSRTTRQGHLMGWVGLGITLLVFVYPIKKRVSRNRRWPRDWFRVHMVAGVMGPLVILLHSGAHLHALVPVARIGSDGSGRRQWNCGTGRPLLSAEDIERQTAATP